MIAKELVRREEETHFNLLFVHLWWVRVYA